jgi:SulP family sulfate permease
MTTTSPGPKRWPSLADVLRGYDAATARRDGVAALTVALFTIPQAMAYALIAGMPPVAGIWAAVAASILGAAFGSSEFLINGPTNAMSVLLAANAALFLSGGDPVAMIVAVTLVIGALQLGAALLRMGALVRFVSEPVLTGFTAGAGIYIAVNQLPAVLGLERGELALQLAGWEPPHNVVFDVLRVVAGFGQANWVALVLGATTFLLVRGFQAAERRLERRVPAPFLAVALVTFGSWLLGLGEPERGSLQLVLVRDIEPLTRALPSPVLPRIDGEALRSLLGPALAIGTLGAVEAIAIGKVLAQRRGHVFDANRQLVGEAICNLGAGLVGGFASSGSFTRSAVNFESGAVTRLSCIFSGVLLAVIVLVFAPAANHIPIAVLAGTLIHVGLKLVNVSRLLRALRATLQDRAVLLVTFLGVLLFEHLQYALFAGIALAVSYALRRAEGFKLTRLDADAHGRVVERPLDDAAGPDVLAIALEGELFFAAAEELERRLAGLLANGTRFLVLRLAHAYNLDATTADALAHVAREARERGGRLILADVKPGPLGTLRRAGAIRHLGADAVFPHEEELLAATRRALAYARRLAVEATGLTARGPA